MPAYTREEVAQIPGSTFGSGSHTLKSFSCNLYEDLENQRWTIEKGPEALPEIDWEATLEDFYTDNPGYPEEKLRDNPDEEFSEEEPEESEAEEPEKESEAENSKSKSDSATSNAPVAPMNNFTPINPPTMAESNPEYVTPKGTRIPMEDVVMNDVSISHRTLTPGREIYDGLNGGRKFRSEQSQKRVGYDAETLLPAISCMLSTHFASPS